MSRRVTRSTVPLARLKKHGTDSSYNQGCGCIKCRTAHREAAQARKNGGKTTLTQALEQAVKDSKKKQPERVTFVITMDEAHRDNERWENRKRRTWKGEA